MEIELDIDDAVMAELERQAARQGRTPSEIVEAALRKYLSAREEAKPRNRQFTLNELIAGMTPDKQHPSLIDDEPRGAEFPNKQP